VSVEGPLGSNIAYFCVLFPPLDPPPFTNKLGPLPAGLLTSMHEKMSENGLSGTPPAGPHIPQWEVGKIGKRENQKFC
jgi:hypothetical protein